MADETNNSEPKNMPQVPPSPGGRDHDILLVEMAKIQSDNEWMKHLLKEGQSDIKDLRARMGVVEVKVDHLPSKGFIIVVVTTALAIGGGLLSFAPALQKLASKLIG